MMLLERKNVSQGKCSRSERVTQDVEETKPVERRCELPHDECRDKKKEAVIRVTSQHSAQSHPPL